MGALLQFKEETRPETFTTSHQKRSDQLASFIDRIPNRFEYLALPGRMDTSSFRNQQK